MVSRDVKIFNELIQEQASQALMGPAVAGKQSALNYFRQIDEREHWLIKIREVTPKNVLFGIRELFYRVVVQDEIWVSGHCVS